MKGVVFDQDRTYQTMKSWMKEMLADLKPVGKSASVVSSEQQIHVPPEAEIVEPYHAKIYDNI